MHIYVCVCQRELDLHRGTHWKTLDLQRHKQTSSSSACLFCIYLHIIFGIRDCQSEQVSCCAGCCSPLLFLVLSCYLRHKNPSYYMNLKIYTLFSKLDFKTLYNLAPTYLYIFIHIYIYMLYVIYVLFEQLRWI